MKYSRINLLRSNRHHVFQHPSHLPRPLIFNASPVPKNDGLALFDLVARDISILERDIELERRQKVGSGGASAGAAGAGASAASLQDSIDTRACS